MIAPAAIVNGLAERLQAIPGLLALLDGGSPASIIPYIDEWPVAVDLTEAIRKLKPGQILVAHQETGPAQLNRMEMWRHRFSLYLKPKGTMSAIWYQVVNGVPTDGDGLPMLLTESIHAGLFRMETPRIVRQFLQITETTVADYFEVTISITEKGI